MLFRSHAGDLHWWHWPGDPEDLNKVRGDNYKKQIAFLENEQIDVSFVVLDPRQEEAGGWGMDYFLQKVNSRYIFPMHCWEKYDLIKQYKEKNDSKYLTGKITGSNRTIFTGHRSKWIHLYFRNHWCGPENRRGKKQHRRAD